MRKHLIWPLAVLGALVLAASANASAVLRPFDVRGGMQVVRGTPQQRVAWWCDMVAHGATRFALDCTLSASGTNQASADFDNAIYPFEFHSAVVNMPVQPVTFCYSGTAWYPDGTSKSSPRTCVTH